MARTDCLPNGVGHLGDLAAIAMKPDSIRFRSAILGAMSLAISAVTVL
jgi:hypothetical protein